MAAFINSHFSQLLIKQFMFWRQQQKLLQKLILELSCFLIFTFSSHEFFLLKNVVFVVVVVLSSFQSCLTQNGKVSNFFVCENKTLLTTEKQQKKVNTIK